MYTVENMALPQPFDEKKLQSLIDTQKSLRERLSQSTTGYAPGTQATADDLATEAALRGINVQVDREKAKQLRERWYGKAKDEDTFKGEGTQESILSQGLGALSAPLYGIAGAAEWATGKGSKKNLLENINANIKEREGFGNLLRRSNVPYAVSMPLGFALDVAFDPINWATAGSAALIPRVAKGLVKGGLTGATSGAVSRLAPLASKTTGVVTLGGKILPKTFGIRNIVAGGRRKLGEIGAKATETYDTAIGREMATSVTGKKFPAYLTRDEAYKKALAEQTATGDIKKMAQTGGTAGYKFKNDNVFSVGDAAEEMLRALPGGDAIVRSFKYSPKTWWRQMKLMQQLQKADPSYLQSGETKAAIRAGAEATVPPQPSLFSDPLVSEGIEAADNVPSFASAEDAAERMRRLLGEAGVDADIEDIMKVKATIAEGKTGGTWYDKMITEGLKNKKWGKYLEKTLDAYSSYIDLFKISKIGLTPSAYTNAIIGNLVMQQMAGINIARGALFKTYAAVAKNVLSGKADDYLIKEILQNPAWREFAKNEPILFSNIFGFNLDDLTRQAALMEDRVTQLTSRIKELRASGSADGIKTAKKLEEEVRAIKNEIASANRLPTGLMRAEKALGREIDNVSQTVPDYAVQPVSLTGTEFMADNAMRRYRMKVGDAAREPGAALRTKIADVALNKSMNWYERIDQIFRLSSALHLSKNGVTESEMKVLARMFGMKSDDIYDIGKNVETGEKMFYLTPEKASEVAMETYLNYQAMPAAVKILRTLPIVGAPFASFTYGFTTRTGKTAMYSPSTFNKMNFLLSELSGDKTPLEKEALKSKYYSWYRDPGMVRIPFMDQYPLYANLSSMIPYYSLNLVTPSERKYGEALPDAVMAFLDKFPILQDPVGQVMFDYFLQPMLLEKGQMPQGAFGQALYPADASLLEKTGYAARQLGEAVVPGVAAYSALGVAPFVTNDELFKYVPSYRWRQIAYATKGKNPLGIPSTEPKGSRTLRAIGATTGVPLQPLNTAFVESQTKKDLRGKINELTK